MRLAKRTYALPSDTIERFEQAVGPGKRSAAGPYFLGGRFVRPLAHEELVPFLV